jgi:hypothetical protein
MTVRVRLALVAALFTMAAVPSYANLLAGEENPAPGDFIFEFGENGNGCFVANASDTCSTAGSLANNGTVLASDPTGGVAGSVLVFTIPTPGEGPVANGDVRIFDPGSSTISDVLRFYNSANPTEALTGATDANRMIFYSGDSFGAEADSGLPSNPTYLDGGGVSENAAGAFSYSGNAGANTYNGISDVPEPVSVGWMAGGIVLLVGLYNRSRRAKQA